MRGSINLPTKLTLMRLLAIPVIAVLLSTPDKWPNFAAAVLFFLAALTDLFDGIIARRRNCVTPLGKLLDPMSDKLLVLTALVFLLALHRVPAWAVAVILGREVAVTTLRAVAASEGMVIAASWPGKIKNLFQLSSTNLLILHHPYFSLDVHRIGTYLLLVAVVLTVVSGIDYFRRFRFSASDRGRP